MELDIKEKFMLINKPFVIQKMYKFTPQMIQQLVDIINNASKEVLENSKTLEMIKDFFCENYSKYTWKFGENIEDPIMICFKYPTHVNNIFREKLLHYLEK
jgi:hypothetical protein